MVIIEKSLQESTTNNPLRDLIIVIVKAVSLGLGRTE
jgi:hypothetical protein